MKRPFFARHAVLILMAIFFLAPFALRGARMALQSMKNDVKDWLPDDFKETAELDWFREHFLGEQFVVVSWEGCTGRSDDESFMTLVDKLFPEVPPSIVQRRAEAAAAGTTELVDDTHSSPLGSEEHWPVEVRRRDFIDPRLDLYVRQLKLTDLPPEQDFIGNQLGLYYAGPDLDNWSGEQEKWLRGFGDQWYYLTPEGDLYQWRGGSSVIQPLVNFVRHLFTREKLHGDHVKSLGALDGPWYYANPRRLAARMFKTVTTGPGVLHELTRPGGSLENDTQTALHRLSGSLFGEDGQQTCLVITLTDAAKRDLRHALGRGILGKPKGELLVLAEEAGIRPPPDPLLLPPAISWMLPPRSMPNPPVIKLGGPPVDNVAIDEEGQITLVRLVGLSVLVGVVLSWLSFHSFAVTAMVFFVGGVSAFASLSIVYWSGQSVDAVLMSMPSLVYVLGLSGAVHIVNYYRESLRETGLQRASGEALRLGWKPCTLAAITTALGLLSLYASNILPIRKFGTFSATGVLATLILLFTFLPAALQLWPPRRFRSAVQGAPKLSRLERGIDQFWQRTGGWVVRHYALVGSFCLIAMVSIGLGVQRIRTDVQLLKMFDADATIIQDYRWLEMNLGRLVPMEIVIRVRPELLRDESARADAPAEAATQDALALNFLERMEIVDYVQQVLEREFGETGERIIGQAMSAVTFAPPLPGSGGGLMKVAERGGMSRSLEDHRDEFLRTDYLRTDRQDESELWRISLRLGALNNVDYGRFVGDLKQAVEPVLQAYRFRQEVLQAIQQQRGADGTRKASVYLVGAPLGRSASAGQPRSDAGSAVEQTGDPTQTEVFAKVLGRLLRNAGLELRDWYDPRFQPPKDWQPLLARQDCVVLIGANSEIDFEVLKQHSPLLIDARDHQFQIGQLSANDRKELVSAVYTGVVPVVYKAQRTLLNSLIESTFWAFVMIAVVMVLVVRSPWAGMLSMIPNVFPVFVIFGFMGWRNLMVDIGSMMTASVAMGVAVDDTIHFLTWFRRGLDKGMDRIGAIMLAYRRVGMAMTQTTAIGGLGLSIFAFSTFTPTQRFGTLMLTLLCTALVGDLIFLPALLASPLGRVFERRAKAKSTTPSREPRIGPPHSIRGRRSDRILQDE